MGRGDQAVGELDIAAVPELRKRLEAAVSLGTRRLLLDFSAITFIDSISLARRSSPRGAGWATGGGWP